MKKRAKKKTTKTKVKKTGKRKHPSVERILNVRPSSDTEKDWLAEDLFSDFAPDAHKGETADGASAGEVGLPASVDLTAGNSWWKIGDQGSTGSCVGWALADSVLRWQMVKGNFINTAEQNRPSVRYVWMSAKETDEFTSRPTTFLERSGTSLKAALNAVKKYGVCKERRLPFHIGTDFLSLRDPYQFWQETARLRILVYANLYRGTLAMLTRWRNWLANYGPILTRLDVDDGFFTCQGYLDNYQRPSERNRGHAVAIVGYTPTTFKVRNSWGEDWGNNGYADASLAYAFAAFTEVYGAVPVAIP